MPVSHLFLTTGQHPWMPLCLVLLGACWGSPPSVDCPRPCNLAGLSPGPPSPICHNLHTALWTPPQESPPDWSIHAGSEALVVQTRGEG